MSRDAQKKSSARAGGRGPTLDGMLRRLREQVEGISTDVELAEYLIEKAGVAMVPGSAFGLPGHMRLSIATGMDNLRNALDRIENVFRS